MKIIYSECSYNNIKGIHLSMWNICTTPFDIFFSIYNVSFFSPRNYVGDHHKHQYNYSNLYHERSQFLCRHDRFTLRNHYYHSFHHGCCTLHLLSISVAVTITIHHYSCEMGGLPNGCPCPNVNGLPFVTPIFPTGFKRSKFGNHLIYGHLWFWSIW